MEDEDEASLGEELFAAAVAVGRARTIVMESAGNAPLSIETLVELKRELHYAALAYADAFRQDPRRAGVFLLDVKGA